MAWHSWVFHCAAGVSQLQHGQHEVSAHRDLRQRRAERSGGAVQRREQPPEAPSQSSGQPGEPGGHRCQEQRYDLFPGLGVPPQEAGSSQYHQQLHQEVATSHPQVLGPDHTAGLQQQDPSFAQEHRQVRIPDLHWRVGQPCQELQEGLVCCYHHLGTKVVRLEGVDGACKTKWRSCPTLYFSADHRNQSH